MDEPENINYKSSHELPYRFYLKDKDNYYELVDLQIKAELKQLDDSVKQQHSLSVYLKPPINQDYRLYSKEYTLKPLGNNFVEYELITIENSPLMSPYISWHGSGKIHANAYTDKVTLSTEPIVGNVPAIAWRDVGMHYDLILRVVIPVSVLSHYKVKPDLSKAIDFSKLDNTITAPDSIILDKKNFDTDIISIDVFIHNAGYKFTKPDQLPYPNGAELVWLGAPITFVNKDSVFAPAVTVFAYQPGGKSKLKDEINPIIMTAISKKHPINDIHIQAIIN